MRTIALCRATGAILFIAGCGGSTSLGFDDPSKLDGAGGSLTPEKVDAAEEAAIPSQGGAAGSINVDPAVGSAGSTAGVADAAIRDGRPPIPVGPFPRRLIFFYTPHGTVLDAWRPTGSSSSFVLSPILAPLSAFKANITVIDGLSNWSAYGVPATTHQSAPSVLLTAALGQPHATLGIPFYWSGAPSLPFLIPANTQFSTVQLGVQTQTQPNNPVFIDFRKAEQPVAPDGNPYAVFDRLFPGSMPPWPSISPEANDNFPAIGKMQMDNLVMAIAAGVTNVATLMWGDNLSQARFTWAVPDTSTGYADLAESSGSGAARTDFVRIQTWFATQFAYLLGKLASIPEGDATLLDRCAVVWINDTGEASTHSGASIPVVVAGGMGGVLRNGLYLRYQNRSQADLLLTLARGLGIQTVGDPSFKAQPLLELSN